MKGLSVYHHTFVVEKEYPHPPEKVFAGFSDKAKKRRWFAEGEGFTVDSFEMDFKEGGREKCLFRYTGGTPDQAVPMTNDTLYLDIETNRRIVLVYTMTMGGKKLSSSLATVEFLSSPKGTHLVSTEQGAYFDDPESAKGREEGWRSLLEELAKELQHA